MEGYPLVLEEKEEGEEEEDLISSQQLPSSSSSSSYSSTINMDEDNLSSSPLLECVLEPDELLYIPSEWWHATLNIGESVFISTFV